MRGHSHHRLLSGLLGLWLMLTCWGCTPPEQVLGDLAPSPPQDAIEEATEETLTPDVAPTSQGRAPSREDRAGGEPPRDLQEELSETVNVKQVTSHLRRAEQSLVRNYDGFLTREALGFDERLIDQVAEDARLTWRTLLAAEEALTRLSLLRTIAGVVPLVLTLLFVILLTLLDRQAMQVAHRLQSRQYSRLSPSLTLGLRTATLLAGQVAGPLGLVALSYFPVRAIFGAQVWTLLLTDTLWLLLGYRLTAGALETWMGLPWMTLSEEHARKLRATLLRGVQVVTIALHALAAGRAFAINAELYALMLFLFKLLVATLPVALVRLRPAVMALFPEQRDASLYAMLIGALTRNYYWLLGLTSLLLAMRAFGYVRASTFILLRGYGVFLLLLGAFLGAAKMREAFARRIEEMDGNDPQRELLSSIQRLLTVAFVVLTSVIGLKMLAIYEPLLLLLKTPLITIQRVEFSIFNALSAGLIVGASALVSKIIKAVLNARVYPSLSVDVGVAYAINTIISYVIVVVGFFLVLVALGVNLSALTVVAASLSVGIGFGLQTLTENLISGFIILFGRTIRKGDYITVNDVYGRVEAVGARSVVVRTMDNYDLLIPSKALVSGTVINWTYRDSIVRLHLPVGVSYGADPREVERVLVEAARRHEHVLSQPKPEAWLVGFGDSAVNFELLLYYDCRVIIAERLRGELYYEIWYALAEAGVEIPFPQRDLHLRSADILPQLERLMRASRGEERAEGDDQPSSAERSD